MINQLWLNTFCKLVEVGHFTLTAQQLFMTQSGVSQHIKKLEQQLAVPLLLRQGKSFTLTDAGKQLYQQGQKLLLSMDKLEQSIKLDDEYQGVVRITSPGSIGLKLYPYLLKQQSAHPGLIIDYLFAPNSDIEQQISSRTRDCGLMTELSKLDNILSQKVALEQLVVITPASVKKVDWAGLMALGFISHPDGNHHAQLLLSQNFKQFEHTNQFPFKGFSNQISLICQPVSYGLGFTVLPLHAAKSFVDQTLITIHPLQQAEYETLYFCVNTHSLASSRTKLIEASIISYLNEK
ncbi:MAG: DNA-binding transcriptional LysR family regulator [Oceanospirillaceae bacterium]|jgi:DNA-binding transcriptional LysR family regulator